MMCTSGEHRTQMASGITWRLQINPLLTCRGSPWGAYCLLGWSNNRSRLRGRFPEQVPIILRSDPNCLLVAVCTTAHCEFYMDATKSHKFDRYKLENFIFLLDSKIKTIVPSPLWEQSDRLTHLRQAGKYGESFSYLLDLSLQRSWGWKHRFQLLLQNTGLTVDKT